MSGCMLSQVPGKELGITSDGFFDLEVWVWARVRVRVWVRVRVRVRV